MTTGFASAIAEAGVNAPGKRGRKHADDLRTVVDAMLYIAQTGCQWRHLPAALLFGVTKDNGTPDCVSMRGCKA